MSTADQPRVRRSLTDLQRGYDDGSDPGPLEDLMRAWQGIKALRPDDPRSFFTLGGYHGEPFRGGGWDSNAYWGGYCQHGNVLFPVWHRAYLYELENALRSIDRCHNVTLPFWDECSPESLAGGIPRALTDETFVLDGQEIANPLHSFTFPVGIVDRISGDDPNYSKPQYYQTVRYPYSGLVGTKAEKDKSELHNKRWTYPEAVRLLNQNVVAWLTQEVVIGGKTVSTGVRQAFADCLSAPNYTVFSNTTSAAAWKEATLQAVVPLESPHNKIHLAVGGFDVPGQGDFSPIKDANGDMGENDTAGLDPIFFFHHCFIDRVFWLWQQRHGATDDLAVIDAYHGTNSADAQGATPGTAPNTWLTMDSPLEPFPRIERGQRPVYTGADMINIERQLGYSYGPGSLEDVARAPGAAAAPAPEPMIHVSGINRGNIPGSFVISAFADVDGEQTLIGSEAVLSRWHTAGCANCQTHLLAGAAFPLHGLSARELEPSVRVEVRTHKGPLGGQLYGVPGAGDSAPADPDHPHFRVRLTEPGGPA